MTNIDNSFIIVTQKEGGRIMEPTSYLTARQDQVFNMTPTIFNEYLKNIKEDDLKVYDEAFAFLSHSDKRSLPYIKQEVIAFMVLHPEYSEFQCKLAELAITFGDIEHYNNCLGLLNNEYHGQPVSDENIAYTFHTTEKNVQMRKALQPELDRFYEKEQPKQYRKTIF